MSISLSEVIENNLVPHEILECIPNEGKCEFCDSEIEFTDTLVNIYCPNRYCGAKIGARLEFMAKAMQVDGWGKSNCRTVCSIFNLKSPYQVFLLEGKSCDSVAAFEKKVNSICDRNKRKLQLWEVVRLGSLPGIDGIAFKIFDGYKTIADAYKDIETYQVPFISNKLGMNESETAVLAVKIYNTLIEYKGELEFAETMFEIYKAEGTNLNIVITGNVSGKGYATKAEFISKIKLITDGVFNIIRQGGVNKETDILISDTEEHSDKYEKALKLQSKGHKIKIMSSTELLEKIRSQSI